MTQNGSFYITTTLPYVNAKPHVGHALEFVRADALARYKALTGYEVFLNTGTGEHGIKIHQKAQQEGKDIKEYVDEYSENILKLTRQLGMATDVPDIKFNFVRTTDEKHIKAAQEFWKSCNEKGYIEKRNYKGLYCTSCELFVSERDVINGKCVNHPGKELIEIEEENYFFKASEFSKKLLEHFKGNSSFVIPESRSNEMKALLERGLEDFSISRVKEKMPWGVPVPGDDTQVMYVWFDALVNYVDVIGWPEDMENFNKWWPVTQYCGKDNTRQQSVMWQAMLLSVGLPMSKQIIVNGFVMGDGGVKMSKSLGNVIDPVEIIDEYGTEALRYYLLREVHPFEDSPFTMEKFAESYNANLVNGLGNLVSRVMKMSENFGTDYTEEQINEVIEGSYDDMFIHGNDSMYHKHTGLYDFSSAMDEIWKEIQGGDEYIQKTEPFKVVKDNKGKAQEDVFAVIHTLIKVAHMLKPMMPETSKKVLQAVRENKKPTEPLFPRK